MARIQRWLVMAILCFSGGIIFMLPFLREVYYIPMQEAFGYDNLQMGILISVFGGASLLTYFPGGWIAADITDPDIIQKILDHIKAQPPPNQPATAIQS